MKSKIRFPFARHCQHAKTFGADGGYPPHHIHALLHRRLRPPQDIQCRTTINRRSQPSGFYPKHP